MSVLSSPSACIEADPELISKVVLMPGDRCELRRLPKPILKTPSASTRCGICWALPEPIGAAGFP
jgi:hypothetical protein